jgi:SAM-dependent methyltransferase
MERAVFDRMAAIDAEHWWFVGRRRIVAHAIAGLSPALPEKARILEVGCGTGSNLLMLRGFGRVDAIEPDPAARRLATERAGIDVGGGLLPDGVRLADGRYDLIVLLDVLEHVERDHASLAALRAKLKPGGRLLLTVPAAPWMWSGHDVAHHHKRRYTVETLCAALGGGGFRLVHMSHFNTLMFPLIALVRLLKRGGDGDDAMPPPPVNRLLGRLFGWERHLATRVSLPFGVSLLAIAEPS